MSYISQLPGKKMSGEIVCSEVVPAVWGWQMAVFNRLAVIVAQHGADVSSCVARYRDVPFEVVQQEAGETPSQLAHRVRERLAQLAESGVRVESAEFYARPDFNVRDVLAAAGLVRGLVAAMVAVGAGHVRLHAASRDVQTRYALTALADAIREQLHGSNVTLLTDFAASLPLETSKPLRVPAPANVR